MIKEREMRDHLERFLTARGIPVSRLAGHVDDVFGSPRLVVAAGSVVHGFGNPHSDVDLLVLVDNARVTNFPLASYDGNQAFDLAYLDAAWARRMGEAVLTGSVLRTVHIPSAYPDINEDLAQFTRLPLGVVLHAQPEWRDWVERMRGPALVQVLRRWWLIETVRCWVAARLLRAGRPWLAAQRYCDAGLAALNARAAHAGEAYFAAKWVGTKLERLGDEAGAGCYRRLLDLPEPGRDTDRYIDDAEQMLSALSVVHPDSPAVRICASYATGVSLLHANGRTLLTRWLMRGVEYSGSPPPQVPADGGPVWTGPLPDAPPWLRDLLCTGMMWLGILDWGGDDRAGLESGADDGAGDDGGGDDRVGLDSAGDDGGGDDGGGDDDPRG